MNVFPLASITQSLVGYLIGTGAAVVVVLLFGITIFVHELGHFLAARLCGLKVDTFSIGFGAALWRKRVNGIDYKIGWIPLGGYVSLPQLDPSGMQTIQGGGEELPPADWWKRIIVSIAGPLGNVVFAFLLALLVWGLPLSEAQRMRFEGAVIGYVEPGSETAASGLRPGDKVLSVNGNSTEHWHEFMTECHLGASGATLSLAVSNILDGVSATVTAPVEKNDLGTFAIPGIWEASLCAVADFVTMDSEASGDPSPAELAGLRPGDVILSVNGTKVVSFMQAIALISQSAENPVRIGYMRNTVRGELAVNAIPREDDAELKRIGVQLAPFSVSVPAWMWFRNPFDQVRADAGSVGRILSGVIAPTQKGESARIGKALGGPVMIVTSMWFTVFSGLAGVLAFLRFLNINLAILNLLPLPVLDGGHIVFALWRGIFRREVPTMIVNVLVNTFAVLLIGVFLLITMRDVWSVSKIFGFGRDSSTIERVEAEASSVDEGFDPALILPTSVD